MDRIENFKLLSKTEVAEQNATLYEYGHINCDARLLYLKTDDKNKLFSITFRTYPEDDTGVFHILEHSVLCGSEKYPVKDPFVELLKGSMNTFLNAITFPDKTMYPVSSRNNKDFLNLTAIYLDAVFRPKIYQNPNIFYQEGFHQELLDKDDELKFNGVVLNEMKGAKSSVDNRLVSVMTRALYPDNCYQYSSGGDPEAIPKLTYEKFLKAHERYYSPNNAIFYLEGDMDIKEPISLIEEYLRKVKPSESLKLAYQKERRVETVRISYPIAKDEDEKERCQILFGKIICDFDDKEKRVALGIANAYLTGSLQAPLVSAIMDKGLGQDVRIDVEGGLYQPFLTIQITNTEEERLNDIKKAIKTVINDLKAKGLDKRELEANINYAEFSFKEAKEPRGLLHNLNVLNSYLYGGDPALFLSANDTFKALREKINSDYYLKLMEEMLDVEKMVTVIANPSKNLALEETAREKEVCTAIRNKMSEDEIVSCINLNKELKKWQETGDSLEALASIPLLALSDVDEKPEEHDLSKVLIGDVEVLVHNAPISDLAYINLYFPISSKYQDSLPKLSLLANILTNIPTSKYDVLTLNQEIKINLGNLGFEYLVCDQNDDINNANIYFTVHLSVLKSKLEEGYALVKNILLDSDYDNKELLINILQPLFEGFRSDIIEAGHSYGTRRALASSSARNAATELLEGLSCYEEVKKLVEDFDKTLPAFIDYLKEAASTIFTSDKLIIGISKPANDKLEEYQLEKLLAGFAKGQKEIHMNISFPKGNTFVEIPSAVAYASCGTNLKNIGGHFDGRFLVLNNIISLEYLWNEIRVKGGAYGSGFSTAMSSSSFFYSYRDPSPMRSFAKYQEFIGFLRNYCESDADIEKYIISSIANTEPLLTPDQLGRAADKEYLCGLDYQKLCDIRKEALMTSKEDLLSLCRMLENYFKSADYCLIGPKMEGFAADVIIKL